MASLTRREFMGGAAAAAALLATGCRTLAARPSNVVCVLIDQLRLDSADRYLEGVNALAERGVVFEGMRAAAPWTYPSVVSLLSGLYPQQHGADGHLHEDTLSHFSPEVPLLQKQLQSAGFTTTAFITNPFLLDWNPFHLGFDAFDSHFIRSQGNRRGDSSVWSPEQMFADSVNASVRGRFEVLPHRTPEFTYVHYIDAHGPWHGAPFTGDYASAIRFVDEKVVELYDYFAERYRGDFVFFVTSDHGRGLDDDQTVGYGPEFRKQKQSIHDYNLRIPFAILPSDFVTQPRRIPGTCSNVDFVPTVLDWLGLPGAEERPGRSLLPAILDGVPLPADRAIYARNSAFGSLTDGVIQGDRKYVRYFDTTSRELVARRVFDLAGDPRETRSLGDDFGATDAIVSAIADTGGVFYQGEFRGLSEENAAQLRALGYLRE